MLKLRTKTEFNAPKDRSQISTIIYLIVDSLFFDINNCTCKGYYYYQNEDNNIVKLDNFETIISWVIINQTEVYILEPITSPNLFDIVKQRLQEFTFLQIEQENGKNYGTNSTDWEVYL